MKLGIVSDEVSEDLKVAAEWAVERGIKRFPAGRITRTKDTVPVSAMPRKKLLPDIMK